ncbi:DNA polymerase I [Tersicoccus solisilvae]|uniref:DNA polymerase I n=1 Tax=Tersicoccus solisilvae TaxID=1882339 RepID=A0ABQ1P257_9MICC|nr:DNA polymerase I [Tersicoccus solisilvae]GGC88886.1 DNA polymerase I [Tersicoccus solisilvae]
MTETTSPDKPTLLLIDGHSMAFRAFFALPVEKFSTTTGQHTNAVYGFTSMLINLLKQERPTHIAVAFDLSTPTFRDAQYDAYKAGRSATPNEFKGQIDLIGRVLTAMNIRTVTAEGFEADDVIATLATQGEDADFDVLVVTGDRDAFQLVDDAVTVLYPRKGVTDLPRMDAAAVEEKYFVPPNRYPDLAALVGETADNLPGVPGVGPKTAAKWITQYDGLEGVLAHADEIKGKAGEALRERLDDVRRNRQLNRLITDVELPVGLDHLGMSAPDREAIDELFDALEIRTLQPRLFELFGEEQQPVVTEEIVPPELAPLTAAAELTAWLDAAPAPVALVPLVDGADATTLVLVAEPAPGQGREDAAGDAVGARIDLTGLDAPAETALAGWLGDRAAPKVVHDLKTVYKLLRGGRGLVLDGVVDDPSLSGYLLQPDRRSYELGDLAQHHLRISIAATEAAGAQTELDLTGDEEQTRLATAARNGIVLLRLSRYLTAELADRGSADLMTRLELPLAKVLGDMELAGIAADAAHLSALTDDFTTAIDAAQREAFAVIGKEINLGSPKQLQAVIFDDLGLPKTKKIKTGYTTDADAITDLIARTDGHPFLVALLAYRDASKLRQTVEGLVKSVADDGRIHTTYVQNIAATGRLSSMNPNLQNIPIRTDEGRRIREVFVVGGGYRTLLTADYSQIEMRIMAHLSGDEALIQAFRDGEDLHRFVGSHVFGVAPEDVTPAMRSKVKAMSYGLAYGLSSFGLSKQLAIGVDEARSLMSDYFARFGAVRDYLRGIVETARKDGYTSTIEGRRRYLPDLSSDNRQLREMAERAALNAPIQGSAADIIKKAMLGVDRGIAAAGLSSRMLLQVHDELVLEVADGEEEQLTALVREQMAGAADLSVPLDVSVGLGRSWHDAAH